MYGCNQGIMVIYFSFLYLFPLKTQVNRYVDIKFYFAGHNKLVRYIFYHIKWDKVRRKFIFIKILYTFFEFNFYFCWEVRRGYSFLGKKPNKNLRYLWVLIFFDVEVILKKKHVYELHLTLWCFNDTK